MRLVCMDETHLLSFHFLRKLQKLNDRFLVKTAAESQAAEVHPGGFLLPDST
jgi:hypothetical protein